MINKIENLFFDVIQKIPDRFIPQFIMNYIDKYLDRRLNELEHQIVKSRWQEVELEKAVKNLHMAAGNRVGGGD